MSPDFAAYLAETEAQALAQAQRECALRGLAVPEAALAAFLRPVMTLVAQASREGYEAGCEACAHLTEQIRDDCPILGRRHYRLLSDFAARFRIEGRQADRSGTQKPPLGIEP